MESSSLHVLIADPHLRGGGQVRYVISLAAALKARGHRVSIACRPGSVLVEQGQGVGATILDRLAYRGGFRPLAWWRDIRQAQAIISETKPDIIHVNGSQDHWTWALANRFMGRPVCVVRTRHNTYTVANHWPNRFLNLKLTDYQIVVCDEVRQSLASQPVFDGRHMCTIHNGVDPLVFQPDAEIAARARAEFGYGDDEVVCGIAARLVPAKGHTFLFRAVAQIAPSYPQLRVLVLGQGGLEEELRALAERLSIQDRIQFAGFRDDIAFCTQAFDIGVLPSIDCDTSSFSLKEEMACAKPVVASNYGGLKEILNDGVEGFVVPAGTVEPIAACLRRLLNDPALRERMGNTGRKRVLREFTLDVFADRTVEAYGRAMHHHQVRGSRNA